MDQSNRYADLSLKEADLIAGGGTSCAPTRLKPKAGYGFLATAAHFAAESSTGTNVEVSTTDDFTRSVDAIVYEADEAAELMKIAYPLELFDRNIIDGKAMIVSFLTLCHRQQPGHGRRRVRQDARLLRAARVPGAVRRAARATSPISGASSAARPPTGG